MNQTSSSGHVIVVDECEIDLKNPYLAAVLAFLFPGAGHFYQGRRNKAYLFAVCIVGLFVLGMFVGSGRVVYASWSPDDFRIQFPAQMCVGIPAMPAVAQALFKKAPDPHGFAAEDSDKKFLGGFMAAPSSRRELSEWHLASSAGFELGSLYTAVAGLLNLLVIFDAFAGPMPLPHTDERRQKKKDAEPSSENAETPAA